MNASKAVLAAFSLSRAVSESARGGLRNGVEFAVLSDACDESGTAFEQHRWTLPWDLLQRDLVAGTPSAAGYLVDTATRAPESILAENSLIGRLGLTVLRALRGNLAIPRETAGPAVGWLSESSTITAAQPALGQVTLSPRHVAGLTVFSRQLGQQAPAVDQFVAQALVRAISAAVDAALVNGPGSTQPIGVLNNSDIPTTSGASFDVATAANMIATLRAANATPGAWLVSPDVEEDLSQREAASGSGFLLDSGRMMGVPAVVSNSAPSATLVLGDWGRVFAGLWDAGPIIEVDPATHFKSGATQVRAIVSLDFAIPQPDALLVATSFS